MTHYEMLVVLPGTLTEAEVKPLIDSVKETAERFGATEMVAHDMGKSRLAYPMKHIRYGYYYILQFAAEESKVQEVQSRVRLISNILRLTFRTYDPATQTVDKTKLTITPLASVVPDEAAPAPRESREYTKRETVKVAPVAEKVEVDAKKAVSIEEIEEKLDKMLEKDLGQV